MNFFFILRFQFLIVIFQIVLYSIGISPYIYVQNGSILDDLKL